MTTPAVPRVDAAETLRRHADHPSGFLALNSGTRHHHGGGDRGLIAYTLRGRHAIQFGGPFAPPQHRAALLAEFRAAVPARLTVAQLRAVDIPLYVGQGFAVNQIGSTYAIDLGAFTTRGRALAKVRQNTARARREGVTVTELAQGEGEDPELSAIDAAWLRDKGRHVKELRFLIGERGGPGAPWRRTFVARREGRTLGYISYSPAYGARPGWLYDLTRRRPDSPVGTVELINLTALTRFQSEGAGWLHLGLTPFAGLAAEHDPPAAGRTLARVVRLLAEHGRAVYPARSQEAFKLKWDPQVIEPEYAAFEGGVSPTAVWNLMRATRAI
ncbi:bifunctional lysylphosphatidylglycerol flippase/synthetase MprF [Kitasatospora sp. NPDC057541]|uniref:bifunctional lysylphosphatidylglycerol flippase/synthetase MprF n=1 Tax=unclassified Kitasatospora TaxID=2633591 RepID=UPI00368A4EF4